MLDLTRKQLFYFQQQLLEVFSERFQVKICLNSITVTTLEAPFKSKVFRTADALKDFLSTPDLESHITQVCWDMEKDRMLKLLETLKFKKDGRFYQRPGADVKVWLYKGHARVSDNSKTAATLEELLTLLSSGECQ